MTVAWSDKQAVAKLDPDGGFYVGDGDPVEYSELIRFANAVGWWNQAALIKLLTGVSAISANMQAAFAAQAVQLTTMQADIAALQAAQNGQVSPGPYYLTDVPPTT
jgi:hypothetical protein